MREFFCEVNLMNVRGAMRVGRVLFAVGIGCAGICPAQQPSASVAPAKMPKLGTVDARFASYNVEMVEVTGGRFWKPYKSKTPAPASAQSQQNPNQPVGESASTFEYRPPIDLSNVRLRKLAAALGPSY